MGKIETTVEALRKELLGNGQPGVVDKIQKHIEYADTRLDSLESTRTYVKGAFTFLGAMLTWIGWETFKKFFHIGGPGA